jgi:hypothetical protein
MTRSGARFCVFGELELRDGAAAIVMPSPWQGRAYCPLHDDVQYQPTRWHRERADRMD